ncbi:MAG: hypothetical protein WAM73_17620 [Desulfobacterales bacterium]
MARLAGIKVKREALPLAAMIPKQLLHIDQLTGKIIKVQSSHHFSDNDNRGGGDGQPLQAKHQVFNSRRPVIQAVFEVQTVQSIHPLVLTDIDTAGYLPLDYNNLVDSLGRGTFTTRNLRTASLSLYQQWGIFAGLLIKVSATTSFFSSPISTMPFPSRT